MARLSVSIDANTAGFVAGMSAMVAAARGAASSIEKSLDRTVGGGSAKSTQALTTATDKLARAKTAEVRASRALENAELRVAEARHKASVASSQQLGAANRLRNAERAQTAALRTREDAIARAAENEARALRKVDAARAKTAEITGEHTGSLASQIAAQNALTDAQKRHGNVVRDTSNQITKAQEAEEKAVRAHSLALQNQALVEDRVTGKQTPINARDIRDLDAAEHRVLSTEADLAQARRANSLAAVTEADKLGKSTRDLAKAQATFDEKSAASSATLSRRLEAENALKTAEENHARATVANSRVAAEQAVAVNRTGEAYRVAKARVDELANAQASLRTAENNLANAQDRHRDTQAATAAATRNLADAQERATGSSTRFGRGIAKITDNKARIDGVANSMVKVGAVGAIGLGLAAAAAINWEKEWTAVTKTVDFSNSKWGSSTAAMAANEDQLRQLSKTIPATHKEIANTAEVLGTLGVGADNLAQFTKVAIQLGTTTNLSAEQAATGLKQFMTVTGDVPTEVGNIASALVALGLDGASTEKQILNTALRIGSAGKSMGFAAEDTLALGSSLASVGIQAEAGGNNMATTLTKIDRAVRGGGEGLQKYADLTGMTAQEFKTAWGKDAPEALAKVLDGLGSFQAQGGNVTDMLRSMGIVNIREIRNMRDLASATKAAGGNEDLYRDQLALSRKERERGLKLNETAEKTYKTDAAKITLALNNINDAAISAGGALLPVVAGLADGIAQAANSFGDLDPAMQGFIIKGAAIVSVALLVGGGLLRMGTGIVSLVAQLKLLGISGSTTVGVLGKLSLALAGIAIGAAAVNALGNYVDKLNSIPDPAKAAGDALDDLSRSGDMTKITKMFDFAGIKTGDLAIYQKDIVGFGDAMARLDTTGMLDTGDRINDFFTGILESLGGGKGIATLTKERVDALDDTLASAAQSGNTEAAGKAFTQLAADAAKSGISLDQLLPRFDSYRETLANVAKDTYGVTLSEQELTDWMGGKIPQAIATSDKALADGADSADALRIGINQVRGSLEELALGSKRTVEQSAGLAQSLFVTGNLAQNAAASHMGFAEAVDQASAVMKKNGEYVTKNGKDLSDNTAKGRENKTALLNLATAGKAWVESLVAQGKGAKRAKDATQQVRDEFIKTAKQAGLSSTAAGKLADSYGLIPKQVSTKINVFMTALDETRVAAFHAQLDALPEEEKTKILAIYEREGADAALRELDRFNDLHVKPKITVTVEDKGMTHIKTEIQKFPKGKTVKITTTSDLHGVISVKKETRTVKGKKVTIKTESDLKGVKTVKTETKNAKGKTVKIVTTTDLKGVKTTKTEVKNTKGKTVKITVTTNASTVAAGARRDMDIPDTTAHINIVTIKTTKTGADIIIGGKKKGSAEAEGGYITGPGTATSDDIPAWLSNGEYVLRAAAVKKLGVSYLHGLNSVGYAHGGKVNRFAAGGAVRLPAGTPTISIPDYTAILKLIYALTDPAKAVRAARDAVTKAATVAKTEAAKIAKPKAALDRATKAYDSATADQTRLKEKRDRLKKEADATKGVTAADKELAKVRNQLSSANTRVGKTSSAKSKAAAAYNKVADKSKAADEKLKEANTALADAQKAVADASREASKTLSEPYRSTSHDIDDWLGAMKEGQADLVKFKAQVQALRKAGLSETLIQQISAQGAIVGQELAGQILAGGKSMVTNLNKANTGLQKAADDIGYVAATGVGRYASGGPVVGPGTGTSDSIHARVSNGEYIVNAHATALNHALLDMINYGTRTRGNNYMPHYASGGYVQRMSPPSRHVRGGDVNFNGQINVIDPDQLMRVAKRRQRDSLIMAGLSVAV